MPRLGAVEGARCSSLALPCSRLLFDYYLNQTDLNMDMDMDTQMTS